MREGDVKLFLGKGAGRVVYGLCYGLAGLLAVSIPIVGIEEFPNIDVPETLENIAFGLGGGTSFLVGFFYPEIKTSYYKKIKTKKTYKTEIDRFKREFDVSVY